MTGADQPSLGDLTRTFGRIGLLSFGGPAAQISLMHRELVEKRLWLKEEEFLRALSLCMLLPGPEAMQLATYSGWRLRGTIGGLIGGGLFVLPGAAVILALALVYVELGDVPLVQAAFAGIKAAVIVIVMQALCKVARKALQTKHALGLALGAFFALFAVGLPYPLIILAAAIYGALFFPLTPARHDPATQRRATPLITLALWGSLWAAPVIFVAAIEHTFLTQIALFFSKLAVVTFGGAYAVLAYMTQSIVADYGWITTAQMIDALGLAETTPGPLILVTEFVALLAGYAQGGVPMALAAGALALWVTFIPCFLWIFLAGPFVEDLAARPRLSAALSGITAAVVGVILNLALWFGMHVLFTETTENTWIYAPLPVWASLDLTALGLTVLAGLILLGLKRSLVETLIVMALAGIMASLL